ncbi:YbbR-like domain-containing protein [Paenibacillus sp. sgz500958]|uniref:CdaR family protein n=1 Tax=Paenibacillus sp. sgz500958 TaxID=3242475 RepID=UPI0036D2A1DC
MDKWMKNNNFNKILALAIGVILWTMVHIDSAPTAQTAANMSSKIIENVKIEVLGYDQDKYEVTVDTDSVRLEVGGKSSDIKFVFSDDYKVTLDLSNVQPGTVRLPLHEELPDGVSLISMTPREVNVHVELRNTKSFPISIATKGEPAEGYQLGTPVIQPIGAAEVTLPASELSKVEKVQGTIELEGESDTIKEKKLKLVAYDSAGNEVKGAVIEPATVAVELPITLPYKSVPLDIGFKGQLPDSLVISSVLPEVDSVVVYGYKENLESITSYEAVIDLSTIESAGTKRIELDLTPPAGVEKMDPGKVAVTLSASEIAERTFEGIPVTLQGLGSGLNAQVNNPPGGTVNLTLSGASTLLDQMDRDQITVVADVSGLTAGTHEVPLLVSLPRFITLNQSSERLVVTVNLQTSILPTPSPGPSTESGSTPESGSEPVNGEGSSSSVQPSHGAGTPEPSSSTGNSEALGTSGNSGNASNKTGT